MSVKRLIWHENEPFLFALHTTYVYPKCTPILIEAYMVLGWLNMAQIENEQQWHFNVKVEPVSRDRKAEKLFFDRYPEFYQFIGNQI